MAILSVVGGDRNAAAALAHAFPDRFLGPMGPSHSPTVGVAFASVDEAERRKVELEGKLNADQVALFFLRDIVYPSAFEAWLREAVASYQSRVDQALMA